MQHDLKQNKQDMLEMKEDIKNTINNNINEKFTSLELKNELLEKKLDEQSTKIYNLERQCRRKNLVFFGLEEEEKSYHQLEEIIINAINNYLKIPCDRSNIEAVRRLGKRGEKIRPVVVTFSTLGYKIKIQTSKKHGLKNTQYYIKEDYPIDILNKRKELQAQVQKEKEAGNTAFIKYDKLIVLNKSSSSSYIQERKNGATYRRTETPNTSVQAAQNDNNKRNLSESPKSPNSNIQPRLHVNNQPSKRYKTTNIKNYMAQTPKIISPQSKNQSETETRISYET